MSARTTPPIESPNEGEEVPIFDEKELKEIGKESRRSAAVFSRAQAVIASVAQGLPYGASANDRDAAELVISVIFWVLYWGERNIVPEGHEHLWTRRFSPIYPDLVRRGITAEQCYSARNMLEGLALRSYAAEEYATLQAFLHSIEQVLDAYALSLEEFP